MRDTATRFRYMIRGSTGARRCARFGVGDDRKVAFESDDVRQLHSRIVTECPNPRRSGVDLSPLTD
jgi:hypothetical protein